VQLLIGYHYLKVNNEVILAQENSEIIALNLIQITLVLNLLMRNNLVKNRFKKHLFPSLLTKAK